MTEPLDPLPFQSTNAVVDPSLSLNAILPSPAGMPNFSQDLFDTVREPLLILDGALRVHSANRAFYEAFHVSAKDTENRLI
jgi:hypothetical protein